MAYAYALDAAVPASDDLVSDGAAVIREFKNAVLERWDTIIDDVTVDPWAIVTSRTVTATLGTLTASRPAFSSTATWNNAAVTFKHHFANVLDTASGASSLFVDYQINSSSRFTVDKGGSVSSGTLTAGGATFFSNVLVSDSTTTLRHTTGNIPLIVDLTATAGERVLINLKRSNSLKGSIGLSALDNFGIFDTGGTRQFTVTFATGAVLSNGSAQFGGAIASLADGSSFGTVEATKLTMAWSGDDRTLLDINLAYNTGVATVAKIKADPPAYSGTITQVLATRAASSAFKFIDFLANSVSVASVRGDGLITCAGGAAITGALTVSSTINSQTISATASLTGSLTVASGFTVNAGTSALQAITGTTLTLSNVITSEGAASSDRIYFNSAGTRKWTWYLASSSLKLFNDRVGVAADAITIDTADSAVTLHNLAGVGSRHVLADANGKLSAP